MFYKIYKENTPVLCNLRVTVKIEQFLPKVDKI